MSQIWHYDLNPTYSGNEVIRLKLPGHPRMLCVRVWNNIPSLYVLVNPSYPELVHEFLLYGTGVATKEAVGEYVDSFKVELPVLLDKTRRKVQTLPFVGHLFIARREVGKKGEE